MRFRGRNALIFIVDDILTLLERRLGIFGPFSFRLLMGLLLGLASLLLFAKLSEDLLFNELLAFDQAGVQAVRYFSTGIMTRAMIGISWLGSPLFLILVGLLGMFYTGVMRRHFWDTILVPTVLIGGLILNSALKYLFRRQRPDAPWLVEVSGFSFPSGHAMLGFIFYGLLIYLGWINFSSRACKLTLTFIFTVVILAVGTSRVYLGVHYPSDVLAGFAAGSFWLVACILGLRGIRYHKAKS